MKPSAEPAQPPARLPPAPQPDLPPSSVPPQRAFAALSISSLNGGPARRRQSPGSPRAPGKPSGTGFGRAPAAYRRHVSP